MKNQDRVPRRSRATPAPKQSRERRSKTAPCGSARQFPHGAGNGPATSKHPRPDGRPGLEWTIPKGADLDPYLAAENLAWVGYTDPTDANLGDLAQRPDGSLVFVTSSTTTPRMMREIAPLEALDWYARNFLPKPLAEAWAQLANPVPQTEPRTALVKRPREDGKPGLQWEGDVQTVEAVEALKCVAIDSNATLPTALYERANGALVRLNEYPGRGVNEWMDISLCEALDWVRNFMAPLEVGGRFGDKVAGLCRRSAPRLDLGPLENSLNKAAALLDLFGDVIESGDDRGEQFNSGCVTLSCEAMKELRGVLEAVCEYQAKADALVVSESALNPGWKQLGPVLNLAEAA